MSFSYGPTSIPPTINPPIDYVRALIADTQQFAADGVTLAYIFKDQEIQAFTQIVGGIWQSSQRFSGPGGQLLPSVPVNYYRVAAAMLFALSANKARLASIKQMLDVKLDSSDAAIQLRATAQSYIDLDENSGAFVVIEQVNDAFSFRDRFWKEIQRRQ